MPPQHAANAASRLKPLLTYIRSPPAGREFFASTALSVDQLAAQASSALPLNPSDPLPKFYNETQPALQQSNWAAWVPSTGPYAGEPVNTQVRRDPRSSGRTRLVEAPAAELRPRPP